MDGLLGRVDKWLSAGGGSDESFYKKMGSRLMYGWLDRVMNERLYRRVFGRLDKGLSRKIDEQMDKKRSDHEIGIEDE